MRKSVLCLRDLASAWQRRKTRPMMLALAFAVGIALSLASGRAAFAQPTTTGEYFPLIPNSSWIYDVTDANGSLRVTVTVSPVPTIINGVATTALMSSDGFTQYVSNDADGVRLHREFDPEAFDVISSHPLRYAHALANVGDTSSATATVNVNLFSLGVFTLAYTLSSTVEHFETVSVPAGTFDTLRVGAVLTFTGTILGQPINETEAETLWLTRGVGIVKRVLGSGPRAEAGTE